MNISPGILALTIARSRYVNDGQSTLESLVAWARRVLPGQEKVL